MDKKFKCVMNILMTTVFTAFFTFYGQLVGIGHIDWKLVPVYVVAGLVLGILVAGNIPAARWGMALAVRMGLRPDGLPAYVAMTAASTAVMTLVFAPSMTCIALTGFYGVPLMGSLMIALSGLPSSYLAGLVFSLVVGKPIEALAARICGVGGGAQSQEIETGE